MCKYLKMKVGKVKNTEPDSFLLCLLKDKRQWAQGKTHILLSNCMKELFHC